MKNIFLLFFLQLLLHQVVAQNAILDQLPGKTEWLQSESKRIRIIFQSGEAKQAAQVLQKIEQLGDALSGDLGYTPQKIDLILQGNTIVSNGFVSQQPRRVEFYTTSPQNPYLLGNTNWLNLLSIHEYRHVVQVGKANTGFNHFLFYLFGYQILDGIKSIAAPSWFLEGDAVWAETEYTLGGRGRIPEFQVGFKANLAAYGTFSFEKQYLGSFKNKIPDHYRVGYLMVDYVRNVHGNQVWDGILSRAYALPIVPFTFSNTMRRETGKYLNPTYKSMMDSLQKVVPHYVKSRENVVSPRTKIFTSYAFPQAIGAENAIVLKSGLGDYPQFVEIKDGKEEVLFVPGLLHDMNSLSAIGNSLVWAQLIYNPRWQLETFSEIKKLDIKSKKARTIKSGRYASPALSLDGKRIVLVENNKGGNCTLLIIDAVSGKELSRFEKSGAYFSEPRFDEEGQVLSTCQEGNLKGLLQWDGKTGWHYVIPLSLHNFSYAVPSKDYIFMNLNVGDTDQIVAYSKQKNTFYQVTDESFGAYNPSVRGNDLWYNNFTAQGLEVKKIKLDTSTWIVLELSEHQQPAKDSVVTVSYDVQPYNKKKSLINLYNWGILGESTLGRDLFIGVRSQNVLSTFTWRGGYQWRYNEGSGKYSVGMSYQGWFPVVDVSVFTGNRKVNGVLEDERGNLKNVTFKWNEDGIKLGLRVPLQLTRSKYSQSLSFESAYGYTNVRNFNQNLRPIDELSNGQLQYAEVALRFNRQHFRSQRDLLSKWGQNFMIGFQHSIPGSDFRASNFYTYLGLSLPSFFKHQGFLIAPSFQRQFVSNEQDTYVFASNSFLPRGHASATYQTMFGLAINYKLPLFYPDFNVGPVLYVKRVTANVFFDQAWTTLFENKEKLNSYGLELNFDMNIMRYRPPVDIGVRVGSTGEGGTFVELIINRLFI